MAEDRLLEQDRARNRNRGHDSDFLQRIRAAYRRSASGQVHTDSQIWNMIFDKSAEIHRALLNDEHVDALESPARSNLFYGFDNMFEEFTVSLSTNAEARTLYIGVCTDYLARLAEAVGVARVRTPEGGSPLPRQKPEPAAVEDMIAALSEELGFELDFPNPFPEEFGLVTSRGIASERAIFAVHQAYRLKQLTEQYGSRVVEIGAGLGRTAYYARRMGIADYTIVDLPLTNLSQANFLGRVLSPDAITLFGEPKRTGAVAILPASEMSAVGRFDVLVNVDSLTEMGQDTASGYARAFAAHGKVLLSLNHEANHDRVSALAALRGKSVGRFPSWFRPGYVEEIFLADVKSGLSASITPPPPGPIGESAGRGRGRRWPRWFRQGPPPAVGGR